MTRGIINFFFTAQISSLEYGKLTCFFSVYEGCDNDKGRLKVDNYIIDKNFEFVNMTWTDYSINSINDIKSSLPNQEKKCLICYKKDLNNIFCFLYDIEKNIYIYSNSIEIENCKK